MTPKIRKPYDASSRTAISFPNATMTKQSFKDECDINTILLKYQKTGFLDPAMVRARGSFGDFTSYDDYHSSLNQIIEAQEAFDQLPSSLRKRFSNDPGELLAFLEDPKNNEEAYKLGLREHPVEPKPTRVEVVTPPQPKGDQAQPESRQEASEKPTPKPPA